jgi:hypothetical protein
MAPAALALPGFPGRELDLQERILRIWPLAALAVYVALDRTWFYHLLDGLTLPLAILAIRGWRRLRLPRIAAVAVTAAVTLPGLVWVVQDLINTRSGAFFAPGEARALAFVEAARPAGPVLAPVTLGVAVPAFTGRQTYVGHYEWTPDLGARSQATETLFEGRATAAQMRALLDASHAAFLISDCEPHRPNLLSLLGSRVVSERRFGCATVYQVHGPGTATARHRKGAPRRSI